MLLSSAMPSIRDLIQMIISESPHALIVVRRDSDNMPRIVFNDNPNNGDPYIYDGEKDSLFEWETVSTDLSWPYIINAGHIESLHTFEIWFTRNPNYKGE